MINKLKNLLVPGGSFADTDFASDDDFLDAAFVEDEAVGGIHGLVSVNHRVPFDKIVPHATFVPGWERRGAPVMDPVAGMIHWTAARPSAKNPAGSLKICVNGRDSIPGPLCQLHIDFNGKVTVIATGRANHAGVGDQSVIAKIRKGTIAPGRPGPNSGGSGGSFIGIEVEHSGNPKVPYPPAVLKAIDETVDAIKKWYGWTDKNWIDHARWTTRKIDCLWARPVIRVLKWLA